MTLDTQQHDNIHNKISINKKKVKIKMNNLINIIVYLKLLINKNPYRLVNDDQIFCYFLNLYSLLHLIIYK